MISAKASAIWLGSLALLFQSSSVHAFCFAEAAQRQSVNACLLKSIASVESSMRPDAVRHPYTAGNKDGSTDYCLMQINDVELAQLRMQPNQVLSDPCLCVHVGAYVLAKKIKKFGPTWKAVGAYNASTPSKQAVYVAKVQKKYAQLCS
jgi:soluble lytic murein transglycosylase-like protein